MGCEAVISFIFSVVLFEFVPAVYSVTEGQTAVVLTVVKTGQSVVPVTVSFSTDDGSAKGASVKFVPLTTTILYFSWTRLYSNNTCAHICTQPSVTGCFS